MWWVIFYLTWARFLSLARSKLRLCSASHSTLRCDWSSTAWAYSEQEKENGPCTFLIPQTFWLSMWPCKDRQHAWKLSYVCGRHRHYCNLRGLTVNKKKTNMIIFNKGGYNISRFKFFLGGNEDSTVNQYCYLGIIFFSCGYFTKAINALTDKAKNAFSDWVD